MGRTGSARTIFATALLLFLCALGAGSAGAQEEAPAWLRIQWAERRLANEEFGRAIQLYREALTLDPGNPEALHGLGRTFRAVSDYPVAEEYLEEALDHVDELRVPAIEYTIRYELAEILSVNRRFAEYEQLLTDIIDRAAEEERPPRAVEVDPAVLLRTFLDAGLDRTLILYRAAEDGATRARGELCELLVGLGRYEAASQSGLFAVTQQLTTLIQALLDHDPDYEFTTTADALALAASYRDTESYLTGSQIYRDMYYLASALYGRGASSRAREVWSLIATEPGAGRMGVRAGIQLSEPEIEPLLVPPE